MRSKPVKLVISNNHNLRFLLDFKLNKCNIKIQYKGNDPNDPRIVDMLEKEVVLNGDTDLEKELEIMYLDYIEKSKIKKYFYERMDGMTEIEFIIEDEDVPSDDN